MKDSFFTRVPKIRTHAEMDAVLKARTKDVRPVGMAPMSGPLPGSIPGTGHSDLTPDPVVKPEALTERPAARVLVWDEPVKHGDGSGYVLSRCGRYSVAKVKTNAEWFYEAYVRLPIPTCIARAKSAPAAQKAAQRHADEHPGG